MQQNKKGVRMKISHGEIDSINMTLHGVNGKGNSNLDCPTIYRAVEELEKVKEKTKVIHIVIHYKNSDKKTANFDSIHKAKSWLNLNDNKE